MVVVLALVAAAVEAILALTFALVVGGVFCYKCSKHTSSPM